MKKLILIPTTLVLCATSVVASCENKNNDTHIFNVCKEHNGNVFVYNNKNFTDAVIWMGKVDFDFVFNFNIISDDILSKLNAADILLYFAIKNYDGYVIDYSKIEIDPLIGCQISSITYNGIELNEGSPEDTQNCYYWTEISSGKRNLGFVLNDFNKESCLSATLTLNKALELDIPIDEEEIFVTPAICFEKGLEINKGR